MAQYLQRQRKDQSTTPERSALMKRVRQSDTPLEIAVRRILHSLGGRYRVNVKGLPGTPDIANRARRRAIFVHGCFWHNHDACSRGRIPKRNRRFWNAKLTANRQRDDLKLEQLRGRGYEVMVIWECDLEKTEDLVKRMERFWFASQDHNASHRRSGALQL
jgi:DNA mismatch endonuclease Vsr